MGLLTTSFVKVGMNGHIVRDSAVDIHKHRQRHPHSSSTNTKSTLASEYDEMYATQDMNVTDDLSIPVATDAPASTVDNLLSPSGGIANQNSKALAKRWIPKKKSGMFTSFTKRNKQPNTTQTRGRLSSFSSCDLSAGGGDDDLSKILNEMKDDNDFRETLDESGGSESISSELSQPSHFEARQRSSIESSEDSLSEEFTEGDGYSTDDLDHYIRDEVPLDSESLLAKLGDSPSSSELANVAAVRANEYINEYLFNNDATTSHGATSGILDRQKWESIPQYPKSDLSVQRHLGKGCFSDAFEVTVMVAVEEKRLDSSDKDSLGRLIDAKFAITKNISEEENEGDDEKKSDLDKEIDAMFGPAPTAPKKPINSQPNGLPGQRPGRRQTMNQQRAISASFCVRKTQASIQPVKKKKMTYAMKCLRPQIRSDAEQFIVGVEDLVHETAMLASLDHPNIIKLHGRAISDSFRLSDGYFILLDRLQDTLEDRIVSWKKATTTGGSGKLSKSSPSPSQLKTASSLADALSYLHSKNIVFRDLKPANVGFDSKDVLKLFDFGFAIGIKNESDVLHDICGTPRYMAPEVALEHGYSLPVDVHSFGILLWEILSLKKPFSHIKSRDEFMKSVFKKGLRPKLPKGWHPCLKNIMRGCWSVEAGERPAMAVVTALLRAHASEVSSTAQQQSNNDGSFRKSLMFRRLTG
mmetsp:Transcript_30108/g.62950  ORF Transcript_30108/g.62950 Transcript_30108/m.62950 type:complete len:697 (+) Transcript_30108:134-2224(+)